MEETEEGEGFTEQETLPLQDETLVEEEEIIENINYQQDQAKDQIQAENQDQKFEQEEEQVLEQELEEDQIQNQELDQNQEPELHDNDLEEGQNFEDNEEDDDMRNKKVKFHDEIEVVKKPLSKWIYYLNEQRSIVSSQNPDLSIGEITKLIAQQYKGLSTDEHLQLDLILEEEKKKYKEYLSKVNTNNLNVDFDKRIDEDSSSLTLNIPLAKIKRTMKMDPEVKTISKETIVTVTKLTELFVGRFAIKCGASASLRGVKTIKTDDLIHAIHANDFLEFLREDFPKVVEEKPTHSTSSNKKTNKRVAIKTSSTNDDKKYSMFNYLSKQTKRKSMDDEDDEEVVEEPINQSSIDQEIVDEDQ